MLLPLFDVQIFHWDRDKTGMRTAIEIRRSFIEEELILQVSDDPKSQAAAQSALPLAMHEWVRHNRGRFHAVSY